MRMRHVAVLLAIVLAAGCTVSTTTGPSKRTGKAPAPDDEPVETVVNVNQQPGDIRQTPQPVREGHALQWAGTKPSDGIQVSVTGLGTERPALSYQPDPPDAVISLSVPPTSLGASVKRVAVSFTFGSKQLDADPFPMATVRVLPGDPVKIQVPIGSQTLRGAFTGTEIPTDLQAAVTFFDEANEPIAGVDGTPLTVMVPIKAGGS